MRREVLLIGEMVDAVEQIVQLTDRTTLRSDLAAPADRGGETTNDGRASRIARR
jgi:hypothetical protein